MRKALMLLILTVLASSSTSCTRVYMDPNVGAETVYLRTLEHQAMFDVEYVRSTDEGPLTWEFNSWTLFWFLPMNQKEAGVWLKESLPVGTEAANLRADVRTKWYGHLLFFPTIGLVRVQRVRYEVDPVRIIPMATTSSDAITTPTKPSK